MKKTEIILRDQDLGLGDFDPNAFMSAGEDAPDPAEEKPDTPKEKPEGDEPDKPKPEGGGEPEPDKPAPAADDKPKEKLELDDPYWSYLQETYPDADIPEDIKQKKEISPQENIKLVNEFIKKNATTSEEEDEFIAQYKEAKKEEGFSLQTWLDSAQQTENILNLPSKELLQRAYKSEAKRKNLDWTDEDIKKRLDNMDKIAMEREADQVRGSIRESRKNAMQKQNQQYKEALEKQALPATMEAQKTIIDTYVDSIKESNNIGGFKFNDAEREEYIEQVRKLNEKKIVDIGGRPTIASEVDILLSEILADPQRAMHELLPALIMIKTGKIKSYSSDLSEEEKAKALSTLNRDPEETSGDANFESFRPEDFMKG